MLNLATSVIRGTGATNALSVLYLMMSYCFTTFAATVFHIGWTKLDQVAELLNDISNFTEYMGGFGVLVKLRKKVVEK